MSSNRPAKGGGGADRPSSSSPARRRSPGGSPRRSASRGRQAPPPKQGSVTKAVQEKRKGSRFLSEVIVELRRVQWPTKSQLLQSTAVVILVVLIVTMYLAAVDAVWSRAVDAIF